MFPPYGSARFKTHLLAYLAYFSACPIFAFLVGLIITSTPPMLKSYKKVLILHIFVDFFYISTSMVFFPDNAIVATPDGVQYFMFTTGFVEYPSPFWTWIVSGVSMFALYWTVSCIPVNYIYRYLLICRNFKLNSKTFVMLVALFSILPIFIGVRLLILFKPSEDDIKYRPLFNNSEYMNDKDTVITFVVGNNYLSPMTLILGIVVVAISYSIVICTSIAITIKLRQLAKTGNTQMGRLQTEITWVLFIQALLPFLGFGLPILMVCVGFFFDVSIPSTDFLTIFSNYAPSLNALFTMFVVGPYRRKIASVLMPKIEQQTSVVNISNKVDNRIRPRAT